LKVEVNNQVYRELGDKWYDAEDDPIALLRAENAFRVAWLNEELKQSGYLQILDVGCGAGLLSNPLSKGGHSVTGLDQAAEALETAKQRDSTGRVMYVVGQAENLPFSNESFDVVCCFDVLEHVESPDLVIAESARVLRPGGRFYFFTFNRTLLSYIMGIKSLEWFLKNTPPNLHVYDMFIQPKEVLEMCDTAGLNVDFLSGFGPKIFQKGVWEMIWRGRVPPDFQFELKRSMAVSYLGRAKRLN
jgi:2-polyprenyl-6-hydroxyphenyl methylase/3-demethylubiquinone-9 3-methyltransferase